MENGWHDDIATAAHAECNINDTYKAFITIKHCQTDTQDWGRESCLDNDPALMLAVSQVP